VGPDRQRRAAMADRAPAVSWEARAARQVAAVSEAPSAAQRVPEEVAAAPMLRRQAGRMEVVETAARVETAEAAIPVQAAVVRALQATAVQAAAPAPAARAPAVLRGAWRRAVLRAAREMAVPVDKMEAVRAGQGVKGERAEPAAQVVAAGRPEKMEALTPVPSRRAHRTLPTRRTHAR
jgi:hypothetical protein